MDCGVPFCHTGCPLGNLIPDWNDLVRARPLARGVRAADATNNFPEFTGKLCPAPCEEACVLALNDDAVTIKQVEMAIADRAFAEGWVVPRPPSARSGRSVAVVGSGPAGLAAAQQLRARRARGDRVRARRPARVACCATGSPTSSSRSDGRPAGRAAGGRGRRVPRAGSSAASTSTPTSCAPGYDAVVLATGAQRQRDLSLPGRELAGIDLAMPYLIALNRRVAGLAADPTALTAAGKRVAILGGGDTSADCLGQRPARGCRLRGRDRPRRRAAGASERRSRRGREWPALLRSYPAHDEGGERRWEIETVAFDGQDGQIASLRARRVEYPEYAATRSRRSVPVEDIALDVDLVLLAIGFVGIEPQDGLAEGLGVGITARGTVETDRGLATGVDGVFACGDCVRGADLIVTAIADGRRAAAAVERALARSATPMV